MPSRKRKSLIYLSILRKAPGDKATAEEEPVIEEIRFPSLPENEPHIKEILDKEVTKRLKKMYPEMPEDMTSMEYKEWEKDVMDEKGIRGAQKLLTDIADVETKVKSDLQKVVFAQNSLQNLYVKSIDEVLPLMTNDNSVAYLKNLNDNFVDVNNRALEDELSGFRKELKKIRRF